MVEGDPVLKERCGFVSIHRHDKDFWPQSGTVDEHWGSSSSSRSGDVGGFVVNVPLRGKWFGDADYVAVFESVVAPLAAQLRPDVVLVSAGYDCAAGDCIGRFSVGAVGFQIMAQLTLGLTEHGRALFVLEGGYDVGDASAGEPGEEGGEAAQGSSVRRQNGPLVDGVAATIEGLIQGPLAVAALDSAMPVGWRRAIKPETTAVIGEVAAKFGAG
jgi:hypothetical protein